MNNLRKIIIGLALTAALGFAGPGFVTDTGSAELQAAVGHWWTDNDVG